MGYSRPHVRQALNAARESGKPVDGLRADDRETTIMLEKWGFLPIDQDALDKRIADWYIGQGLALREGDTPNATPDATPEVVSISAAPSLAALEAAEAALAAASAALRLARSVAS